MAGHVVLMHYYSTETPDAQFFQLGTVTRFTLPSSKTSYHTHTVMKNLLDLTLSKCYIRQEITALIKN